MKKKWLAALAALVLTMGFAACQDEEVPPYLVIEDIDEDDIHGKAVVGVTDPAEVPTHVKIPNGIVRIYYSAFKGCTSIESVEIPKSVKKISYETFAECKNIAVVTYKGSFKNWCAVDWDDDLIRNAKRIILSDGTDLKKLTEITENDLAGVTKIGAGAFNGCANLASVEIPKNVKEIGYGAFAGCKNIAVVTYKGSFKDWCAVDWDRWHLRYAKRIILSDGTDLKKLTEITENDLAGVTKIGAGAFNGCANLASVEIPKNVKEIGYGAFDGCKDIAMVTYKGSFKDWCAVDWDRHLIRNAKRIMLSDGTDPREVTEITANDLDGVTKIGYGAFGECTSLESVTIPSSVKEISYGAFAGCKNIAVVTYKGSFKDWCAVDWDVDLIRNAKRIMLSDGTDPREVTEITANDLDGVTEIGVSAFIGCNSLVSVSIPDGVEKLGEAAFGKCTSLTSVSIPGSVREIGKGAFAGCTSLKEVTFDCSKERVLNQWKTLYSKLSFKRGIVLHCTDGDVVVK